MISPLCHVHQNSLLMSIGSRKRVGSSHRAMQGKSDTSKQPTSSLFRQRGVMHAGCFVIDSVTVLPWQSILFLEDKGNSLFLKKVCCTRNRKHNLYQKLDTAPAPLFPHTWLPLWEVRVFPPPHLHLLLNSLRSWECSWNSWSSWKVCTSTGQDTFLSFP